jgi:hypothetical protein
MSRAAFTLIIIALFPVHGPLAQTPSAKSGPEMIEKAKKLSAVDKNGCLKSDDPREIVVCGESEDTKSQRIFRNQTGNDPQDPNGAAANERAASCIPGTGCIPRKKGGVTMGFGKVPPPAIPLEDVYRGLPEPDMIVPEGTGDVPAVDPPKIS